MKIFVVCCFSLLVLAGSTPLKSDADMDQLADELLRAFSNTNSGADGADSEVIDAEDRELDMRILEDILSSGVEALHVDLQTRMSSRRRFSAFVDNKLIPDIVEYMFDALEGLPQVVRRILLESNEQDFACRLADGGGSPSWVITLKRAFPEVQDLADAICEAFPFRSCQDVFDKAGAVSGQYELTNAEGAAYNVTCEFHADRFYTFIAPTSLSTVPISDLYGDQSEVLIRYRVAETGDQREATFGQIEEYKSRDVSIQYSESEGYNAIQNRQMRPYIYAGLLPIKGIAHKGDTQGYSANGVDKTFTNCDGNPNSYFAVLFNADNKTKTSAGPVGISFMSGWIKESTPVEDARYLLEEYFSFFEMHCGGCGGYVTLTDFPELTGVSMGLRTDII